MKNWLIIGVTIIVVAGFVYAGMDKSQQGKGTEAATENPHSSISDAAVEPITVFPGPEDEAILTLDTMSITRGTLNFNISQMIAGIPVEEDSLNEDRRFELAVGALERLIWKRITSKEMNERGLKMETPQVTDEEVEAELQQRAQAFGSMQAMEQALEEMHPGRGLEAMRNLIRKELSGRERRSLEEALYEDITKDVSLTEKEVASLEGDRSYLETATAEYTGGSVSLADAEDQDQLLELKKVLVFEDWVAESQAKLVSESLEWENEEFRQYFEKHDLLEMLREAGGSHVDAARGIQAPHGMPGSAPPGMFGMGGGMGGAMPPGHPPMTGGDENAQGDEEETEASEPME